MNDDVNVAEEVDEKKVEIPNGFWTIENVDTGEHRTFRIRTQKENAKFAPGERVVGLLTGNDNTSSYTGFGFVFGDRVVVWKKKQSHEPGKKSAFEWYAKMLHDMLLAVEKGESCDWFEKGYKVFGEKRCRKCNKMLTTPESVELGYGPECAKRVGIL